MVPDTAVDLLAKLILGLDTAEDHARYYWLMLAESHRTRRLFGNMASRIATLPVPTG